jgi:hypothetical protein
MNPESYHMHVTNATKTVALVECHRFGTLRKKVSTATRFGYLNRLPQRARLPTHPSNPPLTESKCLKFVGLKDLRILGVPKFMNLLLLPHLLVVHGSVFIPVKKKKTVRWTTKQWSDIFIHFFLVIEQTTKETAAQTKAYVAAIRAEQMQEEFRGFTGQSSEYKSLWKIFMALSDVKTSSRKC